MAHRPPRSEFNPDNPGRRRATPEMDAIAPPRRRPVARRKRQNATGRVVGALVVCVLAIAACYVGYVLGVTPSLVVALQHPTVDKEFPGVNSMNLMIVGHDVDYNDKDQIIKTRGRSDMLMVAHLDFAANTVKMLSIPRDTRTLIPGHGTGKINSAYHYGGAPVSQATIAQNFGITTDHYVALDFAGFEQAIDEIGGVNVTVDRDMDYDDDWGHLHIHLKQGYQHLDGQNAMCFVRFRHADTDLIRTHRQQALVAALKQQMMSARTLAVLPQLINTINSHVDSDLTTRQEIAIANFVHDVPHDNVAMTTMPSDEGSYYVDTRWSEARPLIENWFGVAPPMHHRHRAAYVTASNL